MRSKIEQTKQMTREMIGEAAQERAETMQKNAEVDAPAVKDLFLPGNRYRMPLDHNERRPSRVFFWRSTFRWRRLRGGFFSLGPN